MKSLVTRLNFHIARSWHRFLGWQVRASAIFIVAAFRRAFWKFAYRTFGMGYLRRLYHTVELAADIVATMVNCNNLTKVSAVRHKTYSISKFSTLRDFHLSSSL